MIVVAAEAGALLKMLYSSLLAGLSVAVVVSAAILGATRSSDMRRANRAGAATAYAVLAAVGVALATGIVIYVLIMVARK